MIIKTIVLFQLVMLVTGNSFAQTPEKSISGTVRDVKNQVLVGATVKLLHAKDSTPAGQTLSDAKGRFQFRELANGSYRLSISYTGHSNFSIPAITIDDNHPAISLPAVILLPGKTQDLKEVTVIAKRPLIEQDIDKTIVNVDAMIGSAGNNTYEILEKTPGITINQDGAISLNGKSNVLVLIDGRPTYMSGQDLVNYLKSLPGGVLDKIELIDNPSSRYDAAGGAVINIRLKKNRQAGLTGNMSAEISIGKKFRSNESLNLNFNSEKINWFGNLGYSRGANFGNQFIDRKYYTDNGGLISSVILFNNNDFSNHGFYSRLGFDYYLTPKTIVGMQIRAQMMPSKDDTDLEGSYFDQAHQLDSILTGYSKATRKWKNNSMNINFQQRFKREGNELTADLNYIRYKTTGDQYFNNFVSMPNGPPAPTDIFSYDLISGVTIYNFKADYIYPLVNKVNLEAGIKSSFVSTDNDSRHFNTANNVSTPDYGRSNHFLYKENINAAYISMRKSWKRLGIQFGLRAENTRLKGNQLGNAVVAGSRFNQNFTDLFPTAFINYKLDTVGKNSIGISFSRRINRPGYQLFNPFLVFRDNALYSTGNPSLKPFYLNRVEISLQHKQLLNIRLGYGETKGLVMQSSELKGNIFINRPVNVSTNTQALLAVTFTHSLFKWWSMNYSSQLLYNHLKGTLNEERFTNTNLASRIYLVNQFKINAQWSADFNWYYSGREFNDQFSRRSKNYFNGSIQKKIWNNMGTLAIAGEDIFHTWRNIANLEGVKQADIYQTFDFDTQRVRIIFTWRFGNEKFLRKRRHTDNAADPETGRVQ